jgi:hypothetical protein
MLCARSPWQQRTTGESTRLPIALVYYYYHADYYRRRRNAHAFNDISTGANRGFCGGKNQGFAASEGWDPVTGVGTPNYMKLADVVSKLPH